MSAHSKQAADDLPAYTPVTGYLNTTSPNPSWGYGQRIESSPAGKAWAEGEKEGWTVIDPQTEDRRRLYLLLQTAIVPRPIALVSTVSEDGLENLAPISWFNEVSPYPVVISLSISSRSGTPKDTLRNILAIKEFTVNLISEPWMVQAHAASIDAPPDVGEWPITGLTKAPCLKVRTARVLESACAMECELLQTVEIKDPDTGAVNNTLVLGSVKYIHVRNDVINPDRGTIDPGKMKPIGRMGGAGYVRIAEGYSIGRPDLAAAQEATRRAVVNERVRM
ncbi:hypothetical protein BJ165DRAFT_15538 [Panaeolus papilionaceus]|nr:hypothetical protein BJ165DRAFT_15538 [Panaeolus papilionaceus]